MSQIITDEQKISALVDYYKNDGLTIIGLNDSQGVNTTPTFFKKGLLEYMARSLTTKELTPNVINAFSLLMNKTEHIDYFFRSNLSLEEIKLSQTYSVVQALEKVMGDLHLPRMLCNLGYVYKLIYTPKNGDADIRISTVLKESKEPVLIYSSGVNNLMREIGNNPFSIKKDYNKRFISKKYEYALQKANNPNCLYMVMDGIERNFENILSINNDTDIYALGAYIPKLLESEGMDLFKELIASYNEILKGICQKYHVTYINMERIGRKFNNSKTNFHISTTGHNKLANYILGHMYENKIANPTSRTFYSDKMHVVFDDGSKGMIDSLEYDCAQRLLESVTLNGYDKERQLAIAREHDREVNVFKKVLHKTEKK